MSRVIRRPLFFCGHFGRATPASRRLNQQTMSGLAILEAIAFAFAATLLLGFTAGVVAAATGVRVHPMWIVLAEPLRGVGLVLAARRYR